MSNVRLRRLTVDYQNLQDYVRCHPRVRLLQAEGDPPERYQLEYRVRSLRMSDGEPNFVLQHMVEIALPRNYPRTPPQCRMLSPVFHPNIAPHAICVGDHWGPGESLQSIVTRIGEMLAFQSYNVKSPLNGEAARWVEQNKQLLPLDRVSLLVEDDGPESAQAATSVSEPARNGNPQPKPPAPVIVVCPACQAKYRVNGDVVGKNVRCRKCQHVFQAGIPSPTPGALESMAKHDEPTE